MHTVMSLGTAVCELFLFCNKSKKPCSDSGELNIDERWTIAVQLQPTEERKEAVK